MAAPRAEIEQHYSGLAITVTPLFGRGAVDPGVRRRCIAAIGSSARSRCTGGSFVSIGLAAAIINIVGIATPLFTMNVLRSRSAKHGDGDTLGSRDRFCGRLDVRPGAQDGACALLDTVGKVLDIELSSAIFEKIMNTPLMARSNSTGEFVNRARNRFVREFFTSSTIVLFVDAAFVFVYLIVIYAWPAGSSSSRSSL